MVNYREFNTTGDHSYNVYNALKYCKEHNEDTIVFDYGIYEFYGERASEDLLHISNHNINQICKIAFLIKDMENFTIDAKGSKFIFHSSIIPFAVVNSCNITLKDFCIDVDETLVLQGKVSEVGNDWFDMQIENQDKYYVQNGKLHYYDAAGNDDVFHNIGIVSVNKERRFPTNAQDYNRVDKPNIYFEEVGEKKLRVYNSDLNVDTSTYVVTGCADRYACSIAIRDSKSVTVKDAEILRSYGMGVIAQMTENITIDRIVVKPGEKLLFSLNADATHFVHCKGLVEVKNCRFSGQRDDSLNIHGVFTKVIEKTDEYILVKYMHAQAKGLNIYRKDSEFAVVNPNTLIAKGRHKIAAVEVINMGYTKIYVSGGTMDINVGELIEDLTWSCDLVFKNNRVENHRARGMLVAAKGNVLISNNYFNTPGPAIIFESNGTKWYEAGGTNSVRILNNTFDNCCYTDIWGKNVIDVIARDEFNGRDYYHQYIEIQDNTFANCTKQLLYANNVKTLVFKNNNKKNTDAIKEAEAENYAEFISDDRYI